MPGEIAREKTAERHIPVLLEELVNTIEIRSDRRNVIIDATLGMGGHANKILEKMSVGDVFVGFDADIDNLEMAKNNLLELHLGRGIDMYFINSNYSLLKKELDKIGINEITGIYYDLGLSSLHLDIGEKGFSFMKDGPLDMRLDKSRGKTARDIVNTYPEKELKRIFFEYGEELSSSKIAKIIVERRKKKKFERTLELAEIIPSGIKAKSRIFQAIRIEVNNELVQLEKSLRDAIELLESNGTIFVISFHSLEDRITKNILKNETRDCICEELICTCKHKKQLILLNKKPILPSNKETSENTRSRSAKARAAKKI